MGERHELPHRERRGRIDETDQAVLEPGALVGGGGSGQDLEAAVDLERIGRDRHGILTTLAQAIRERERHGGLADAGRPEDRDYGRRLGAHATRASKRSSPASVVLVAESMRTCTSSPGEAAPSKFTVLL